MKHSQETIDKVIALKAEGLSSRAIGAILGIGKSTVNDIYNRTTNAELIDWEWDAEVSTPEYNPENVAFKKKGPRILVLDLETAASTVMTFGRYNINLSQDNIVTEGGWILCASWRWFGSPTTFSLALTPNEIKQQDDGRIVAELFELYEQADAILAHNSLGFDHKVVQTRALYHGFPALPVVKVLDTLALAKKNLKLPSNKLDSIGEYFNLGRKLSTGGITLWKEVQSGDEEAMKKMQLYCMQDVELLYDVYVKIRQAGKAGSDFNAALYFDDGEKRCRTCGSTDLVETGRKITTSVSTFEEVRCNCCGSVHRTRKSTTSKEKSKSLII